MRKTVKAREAALDARLGKTFCCIDMGADAPDTTKSDAIAEKQANLSEEQWNDYKKNMQPLVLEQMRKTIDNGDLMTQSAIEEQKFQLGLSKKYDDRYWNTQVPLEDSLISEANNYDTDAERERMAGQANADVRTQFGASREQMMRDMASRGVDPGSPSAYMAAGSMGAREAASAAAAMNKTREAARSMGWAKKLDAASLAKGLPGFTSSASQMALGWNGQGLTAGASGLGAATAASGATNSAAATALGGYGQAVNSYGVGIQARQKAEDNKSSMAGAGVGAAATVAAAVFI